MAYAQTVTLPQEYSKLIQTRAEIQDLGTKLFGDDIDLYGGGLSLTQTDIDIPGNSALPMRVTRRFQSGQGDDAGRGLFADWELDIPHIEGVFSQKSGWRVPGVGTIGLQRCSSFAPPPVVSGNVVGNGGGTFEGREYWQGTFLQLPGGGSQELLKRASTNTHFPNDGANYPIVTKDGTAVRCLTTLATSSQSGSAGEGFEAVAPDGTIYTFNHMVVRQHSSLQKSESAPLLDARTAGVLRVPVSGYILNRQKYMLFPTLVRDRFGNTLTYAWNSLKPLQLQSITASDGRTLTFTYSTDGLTITAVSDGARSWQYGYQAYGSVMNQLASVTQPDNNKWTYAIAALALARPQLTAGEPNCDTAGQASNTVTGTMTHPSGAVAEFTLKATLMGRSWVSRQCYGGDGTTPHVGPNATYPYQHHSMAVSRKLLKGPGLPAQGFAWTFDYGNPNSCWHPDTVPSQAWQMAVRCTASSPVTRTTILRDPQGDLTTYVFGNQVLVNEGLLLRTESGHEGEAPKRIVVNTYAEATSSAAYAPFGGMAGQDRGDGPMTAKQLPTRRVDTYQDGVTFTWKVESGCNAGPYCFDEFARPTKVTKSSAPTP